MYEQIPPTCQSVFLQLGGRQDALPPSCISCNASCGDSSHTSAACSIAILNYQRVARNDWEWYPRSNSIDIQSPTHLHGTANVPPSFLTLVSNSLVDGTPLQHLTTFMSAWHIRCMICPYVIMHSRLAVNPGNGKSYLSVVQ